MSSKDLVIRYFKEVLEEGKIELIDEIVHPDYSAMRYYGDPHDFGPGIEKLKKRIKLWTDTFSEKFLLMQIMENDNAVFCEYRVTTKQNKTWFNRRPRDKTAKVNGFVLFEIKNNKILKIKDIFDYNDFWSQLGHLVDAGRYELSSELIFAGTSKIKLKQDEVLKLENDYSILQSSALQYRDLLQYASYVSQYLEISEKAIRSITITSVIEWQLEFNKFQSELTGTLPQERMMNTIWILERGKEKVQNLLVHKDDIVKLDEIFQNLIDFFAKEYSN